MIARPASVPNALYTVRTGYTVTKFSPDLDPLEVYSTSAEGCTCPAGHAPTCRHRQILQAFLEADRVDSGWMVNWDKTEWIPPLENEA